MHDRAERDTHDVHQDPSNGRLDSHSDGRDSKQERFVGAGHDKHNLGDESGHSGRDGGNGRSEAASRSVEPPERHSQIPQDNLNYRGSLSWKSPHNDRKRPYDGHNQSRGSDDRNTHPGGSSHNGGSNYGPGSSHDNYSNYPAKRR